MITITLPITQSEIDALRDFLAKVDGKPTVVAVGTFTYETSPEAAKEKPAEKPAKAAKEKPAPKTQPAGEKLAGESTDPFKKEIEKIEKTHGSVSSADETKATTPMPMSMGELITRCATISRIDTLAVLGTFSAKRLSEVPADKHDELREALLVKFETLR